MKEGWERKKIKDISVLIADGDWIESKHQSDEGIRLIQTGNIGNGVFKAKEDKPHYISEYTFDELGCTEIFSGDCLVSRLPEPVGRACLIPEIGCRMITAVDCSIIRFKEIILPKLFIYYTQSATYNRDVSNLTTGTTRKRISRKNLESILIPIPPLEEQGRIVGELDCLSGVIEKKKEQLMELDALAQSIFYEMFGNPVENDRAWEVSSMDNLCSSIVRGPFGSALKKDFFIEPNKDAYKVYEQKHAIQKNAEIGTYYISAERFRTLSRFEVKVGDIIMSCSGTIGEFYEIPIGAEKGLMNQALLKFTLNKSIEKLYFLFAMEWVKNNFEKKGSGLQNIGSVGTIKKTQISLPPLSLQQQFADKIELIEKQKELVRKSIEEVEMLFNSRMDYYFG